MKCKTHDPSRSSFRDRRFLAWAPHWRGEAIVEFVADRARTQGLSHLFVLTTQSAHFFRERAFEPVSVRRLPAERRARFDHKRRSKVLFRAL
jgi:amino-acid N-acetyltransferase